MLLRTLGGWGRDWRMASYLLFESAYCKELIQLGYEDGLRLRPEFTDFIAPGKGVSAAAASPTRRGWGGWRTPP